MSLNRKNLGKIIILLLFFIYIGALLKITVFRSGFSTKNLFVDGNISVLPFYGYFRLITHYKWFQFVYLFVGNIIWFIPFGIFIPIIIKKNVSLLYMALYGLLISFTIELAQYVFGVGVSEIDDLILNTSGVLIGYISYRTCKK